MDRTQMAGALIMFGAVSQVILFLFGAARKSYAALALPVFGALGGVSALAFWIGWTMLTTEAEIEEEFNEETA
ncbi:MAG: hypothetical protein GEU28_10850 [Dehalococcoidia bacterium]|nr:hypothetical protein [Dehalococcoidia bacterium]